MNDKDYRKFIRSQSLMKTPLEEEYGYEHKDIKTDKKLTKIVKSIISGKPSPLFYAEAWENAFIIKPEISKDDISAAIKYFSDEAEFIPKLRNRPDSEILLAQIYRAKCFFYPLILIENQRFTGDDPNVCFPDSFSLSMETYRVIKTFCEYVDSNSMKETLSTYVSKIRYSNEVSNLSKTVITRAQFAVLVFVLSSMQKYDMIIALNKAKIILTGMEIRKPTKVLTHVLCCIIYNLLQKYTAAGAKTKLKGYCRDVTAVIVTYISPKDQDNVPFSSITSRGVEVALTGK